jgi:Sulfotransferase domain.
MAVTSSVFKFDSLKVNFLVAGAQKSGTTALDAYLRQHPQLSMALRKEVHYFDNEALHSGGGTPDYAIYHQFFNPASPNLLLGETTPIYMYWHRAVSRIQQYNPAMKLIISLRNPIERAFSHWNMSRQRGVEHRTFWDAICEESDETSGLYRAKSSRFLISTGVFYFAQLSRIWNYFPQSQTLIVRQEDLKNRPKEVLNKICAFLGVRPYEVILRETVHKRMYADSMSNRERVYLETIFEHDIQALAAEFSWDCSDWFTRD